MIGLARRLLPLVIMMKVAIPHWQGRVSPVFDVAGAVRIVTISNGLQHERREVVFDAEGIPERVGRLAETGVDVLICGAISWPLEMAVSAAGIEVIPQVCGDVEQVLTAWTDGRFRQEAFLMPGCCGRRRQRRAGRRRGGCW